jgi:LmbE family N-acetylglucosaminyl deacetylase
MATLVCFHAHPDDESISTGGTIARAADEGHRVVLVVATDGSHGEVPDDLGRDETLAQRRQAETLASADALGIQRVVFLEYRDSGMTGWEGNGHDEAFWNADLDEAGERLAAVLREERADVLSIYDWHGLYGHPDHVQVHRVGCRAAELVRDQLPGLRVVETTMNRDEMRRGVERMREAGESGVDFDEFDVDGPADDGNPMGTPESELTLGIDVRRWAPRKRASISAHRSQATDSGFFLQMSDEAFAEAFGTEWFIEQDREPGNHRIGWLFE